MLRTAKIVESKATVLCKLEMPFAARVKFNSRFLRMILTDIERNVTLALSDQGVSEPQSNIFTKLIYPTSTVA